MSSIAAPNFGSKPPAGSASSGDSLPPGIAQRLRDCDEAHTRLVGDGKHIDITAPWAGDKHTLGVKAAVGEIAAALADRVLADPSFAREGDAVDSITLLSSTGIGAELHQALAERGSPVRVYEASTSLLTDSPFAIAEGGHWVLHGELTATHELAVTYELIRAQQAGFTYASSPARVPGTKVPLDDRAGTLGLLDAAVTGALTAIEETGGVLDLAEAARVLSQSSRPELLWPGLMRLLRGKLGQVDTVVDMVRDGDQWRTVDVPAEVRRLFTATGQHELLGDKGQRSVDFNRPDRLLSGAAAERPATPETLATWLAESAVDRTAVGKALPTADAAGDTGLQRDLIARLQALKVGAQDARAWADLMVNGTRDQALPAQIRVAEDTDPAFAIDEPVDVAATPETTVSAPLGGGVHQVLQNVLAQQPEALDAAYEVAAHYLHDKTGDEVSATDAAALATMSWPVATLVEVITLGHLALQGALDPQRPLPAAVRQPLAVLNAAAGPDLRTFLATHEDVIRQALADTLPLPEGDTPLWETPIGSEATLGDLLTELLNPEQTPGEQRLSGLSGPAPVAVEGPEDGPWHLPRVDLRLAEAPQAEMALTALETASLLTELDTDPRALELAESLAGSASVGRLRGLIDDARTRHPQLDAAGHDLLRGVYQRDVAPWLAPALADLPPWDGVAADSPQRVGTILRVARAISGPPADWTPPALAEALTGEWRDVAIEGLWRLPEGTVTPLWVQRDGDPEHLVLAERTATGLTLVETRTPAGAQVYQVTDAAGADALLRGPVRAVVDQGDWIVALTPGGTANGAAERPPVRTAGATLAGGLSAPNFGGPTSVAAPVGVPGAVRGVPGVGRFDAAPDVVVITVDDRTAKIAQVAEYLSGLGPVNGFLVWHGQTIASPDGFSYRQLAHDFGLHSLEPAPSKFADPVVVDRAGGYLVSPTGWWVEDPAGRPAADQRGALSASDLVSITRDGLPIPSAEGIAESYPWLEQVNPYYGSGTDSTTNCVLTSIATDLSLKDGVGHLAPPSTTTPAADLVAFADRPMATVPNLDFVVGLMRNAPRGSRGILIVGAPDEISHAVNVVHDKNGILFLDGNRGALADLASFDGAHLRFVPTTEGVLDGPLDPAMDLGHEGMVGMYGSPYGYSHQGRQPSQNHIALQQARMRREAQEAAQRAQQQLNHQFAQWGAENLRLVDVGREVLAYTKRKLRRGAANQASAYASSGGETARRLDIIRAGVRSTRDFKLQQGAYAAAAEALEVGNCGENAAVSFSRANHILPRYLNELPPGTKIATVVLDIDHTYTVIGVPDNPDRQVVIDAWQVNPQPRTGAYFARDWPSMYTDRVSWNWHDADGRKLTDEALRHGLVEEQVLQSHMDLGREHVSMDDAFAERPGFMYHHVMERQQPAPVQYQPAPVQYQPAPVQYQPAPAFYPPAPVHYSPHSAPMDVDMEPPSWYYRSTGEAHRFAVETPSDATAEQIADAYPWLPDVNPHRTQNPEDLRDTPFTLNCVITAIATDMSLVDGVGHQAAGVDVPEHPGDQRGLPESDLANYQAQLLDLVDGDSRAYSFGNLDDVRDVMRSAPEGSRAIVLIREPGSAESHAFNVVRDQHGVSFLDGQRGAAARRPETVAEVAFLPLSHAIAVPPGRQRISLTGEREATRTPESVGSMTRLLERAANGVSREVLPLRLAERRFPTGLRLAPSEDAETTRTADWVGERLDDPTKAGVHRPQTWTVFRGLIERAGEDGMVLTLPEPGREPAVFMKAGGQIWQVHMDSDGVTAEPWTEPPALPGMAEPPRMALAFNKCADFLT